MKTAEVKLSHLNSMWPIDYRVLVVNLHLNEGEPHNNEIVDLLCLYRLLGMGY